MINHKSKTIVQYQSVLPVISKIFENVMHTQLLEYFTDNNLLSSQQYGFRSNRSTELAALELMDRNIGVRPLLMEPGTIDYGTPERP